MLAAKAVQVRVVARVDLVVPVAEIAEATTADRADRAELAAEDLEEVEEATAVLAAVTELLAVTVLGEAKEVRRADEGVARVAEPVVEWSAAGQPEARAERAVRPQKRCHGRLTCSLP